MEPARPLHHLSSLTRERLEAAIESGLDALFSAQDPRGSWRGDYGGPLFLLPLYVAVSYITGAGLGTGERPEVVRYLRSHQNRDGGWGLHVEGSSHVFTTACNYVALRLLGEDAADPELRRARDWLWAAGGPLGSASWGKFFLALLGLYEYDGLSPIPPELWLLPRALPFHPGRLWCHCRMVYLPMSYLYGQRAHAPLDPLLGDLRSELYPQGYESVDWQQGREAVAPSDRYLPRSSLARALLSALARYELRHHQGLRRRALSYVLEQVRQEDENTNYICIGPVSKLLHTLIWYWQDAQGKPFARHVDMMPEYLWRGADGVKMQGYNGSELWDTAFAVQAVVATGRAANHRDGLRRAHQYIDDQQVREDVPRRRRYFRDPSKGGWPFSTRPHGWPITDCTAEGLKACLALEAHVPSPLAEERLTESVDLMLWWQNRDGSWATYERTRGPRWLELLNPSDCFGDIMIDYPFVECTSACLQGLAAYRRRFPGRRDRAIRAATAAGRDFLLGEQREDGSFYGSWGICFTYGTWFGVSGLRVAGLTTEHPAIERACEFLLSVELPSGGWGETADSSRLLRYVSTESGQAVMTSWAMLTLAQGGARYLPALARGARFLLARQRQDGSWPAEHIAGMFNRTCAIHYDNYLKYFPVWALASARRAAG
jgi:squalene/oxidosqualene cyclase-like protein